MKRTKTARAIAARARYLEDCARFGLVHADELARDRQSQTLDLIKLALAEELS